VLAALFAAIYSDALGHGFVKDDFRWIAAADVHSFADVRRVFSTNVGFYRPLVTLSFAIDRGIWNLDPRGYALTNVTLLAADVALLFMLARRLSLSSAAALSAAAIWMFNFHGINMALLWISGRTTLLLCFFSLAATLAWIRRWPVAAGFFTLAAMLCKEEALMLPALLVMVDLCAGHIRGRSSAVVNSVVRQSWPLWAAAGVYLLVRAQSGAFGLTNAPDYYRLTFQPRVVIKNATGYLDRGATWATVAAILMFFCAPRSAPVTADERRVIRVGVLWCAWMFAITVFVPTRSSLYAVAPSIGSALAAAAFASRAQRVAPRRFALVSTFLIAVVASAVPVYRMRNRGLVEPGDLSTQALAEIVQAAQERPHVREIVLLDEPAAPVTLADAFGALAPDAVHLFVSPGVRVRMGASVTATTGNDEKLLMFRLRAGRLVQDGTRTNGSPADTSPAHSG
jgi:hypothetical protein